MPLPFPQLYPFTPKQFLSNGVMQNYLDEGTGDPVVMLHGNPTWSFYFRNLVLNLGIQLVEMGIFGNEFWIKLAFLRNKEPFLVEFAWFPIRTRQVDPRVCHVGRVTPSNERTRKSIWLMLTRTPE